MLLKNKNFKIRLASLLVALLALVALPLTGCSTDETDSGIAIPAGMQVLREGDGYVCFVPTDWKLGSRFGVDYAYLDFYYCSISLSVTPTELTDASDAFKDDLEHFRESFADFKLITKEEGETTTVGLDTEYKYAAVSYVYTMTVDGAANKYKQCLFIRDGKLFILTYTAAAESTYDEYIDAFDNVLADFLFTDAAKNDTTSFVPPSADGIDLPAEMKLACDPELADYLLFVPETWTVTASDGLSAAHATDPRVTVNVSSHSPGTTSTIVDYFDDYIEKLGKNLAELEVTERYEVTKDTEAEKILYLDRAPAFRYSFTGKWMGVEYTFIQYVAISNSEMHFVTFSAPSSVFSDSTGDFDKIIENFKFD